MTLDQFRNPFRPGAGHMPPYLAGRECEIKEFERLLKQEDVILENLVLTGLRGVGKTVLLETFRPIAIKSRWLWVGADMSESLNISEERLATRLLTDLSVVTSSIQVDTHEVRTLGFNSTTYQQGVYLNFESLCEIYKSTPGLVSDKLKNVLELVWPYLQRAGHKGVVFAYDEAQNLSDYAERDQYALSLLLDIFQSIQRKQIPFMLTLVGLPTLFPNLVESRTYSERMFRVLFLDRLASKACKEAIAKPIEEDCPFRFDTNSIDSICEISGGYPYFIQFICREVFDVWIQQDRSGVKPSVPVDSILRKLDSDFFIGRWSRATDRQRDLLTVIANLSESDNEFSVQEIVDASKNAPSQKFSNSHANQMLVALSKAGLVYKNRHGRYSFAVPLLGSFIRRQDFS